MEAIRPITVTEAMLISSTVAEADSTEWTSGDSFDLYETCMVTSATLSGGPASAPYMATHRGNFIDGNAFIEINATDLTLFQGTDSGDTPYKITLTDAASKTCVGYIGASGAGRVLSSELISDGTFATIASPTWTKQAGWTIVNFGGGNNGPRSANGLLCYCEAGLIANQLYLAGMNVKARTSGDVALFYGAGTNHFTHRTAVASFTEYAMTDGTNGTIGVNGFSASAADVDDVTCKKVLEPVVAASGGLHIVSELDGTIRNWSTTEGDGLAGGFNPMTIVSYAITPSTGHHRIYESQEATNSGHFPPTSLSSIWLDIGATNRWRVFDGKIQDQASQATSMQWVVDPGAIDSIALFGLDADYVIISVSGGSAAYDVTIPVVDVTAIVRTDVPGDADCRVTITIYKNGTARCGEIVMGSKYSLGTTTPDPSVGITDYSIKEPDTYGNYYITERAYSSRGEFVTIIPTSGADDTFNFLTSYRAHPLVWVASEDYATLILYGFYKDFVINMTSPNWSTLNVSIEGLT